MIKVLIFDFDGVIVDSNKIKADAFAKLFDSQGEEFKEKVREFHFRHPNLSRYEKITELCRLAGISANAVVLKEMANTFSKYISENLHEIKPLNGALDFLAKHHEKRKFIVSRADKQEIIKIITNLGIDDYFVEVYGMELPKTEALLKIIRDEDVSKEEAIFFGDAESDMLAANEAGVHFSLVSGSMEDIENI